MAPHSSTLAWKIPWTEEPGGLQSMGSRRVGHNFTFTFPFHALEKEMTTHSNVLAWRIPGTAEPGGLPSMGSHSRTRLKRLSSSSSSIHISTLFRCFSQKIISVLRRVSCAMKQVLISYILYISWCVCVNPSFPIYPSLSPLVTLNLYCAWLLLHGRIEWMA